MRVFCSFKTGRAGVDLPAVSFGLLLAWLVASGVAVFAAPCMSKDKPRANPTPICLEVAAVAAVAVVAATAAYTRRLRAELAAAKRDNDEFVAAAPRDKLEQQQQQPPPQQAPPQQVIEQMSHEHF